MPLACDRRVWSSERKRFLTVNTPSESAPSTQPGTRRRSSGQCAWTTRRPIRSNPRSLAARAGGRRTSSTCVGPTARPNTHPSSRRTGRRARLSAACAAAGARRTCPLLSGLSFPVAGDYTARVWLEDAAGNQRSQSAISTVQMRYDPIAPSVTFEPPDPSDPLRVAITASDKHSGVASGEIEIRRVGTSAWHGIDTKLSSPGLVAYVDDERFRNGVYEFRAHATDRAGNEASIGPKDAGAASLRLPVRATTKLRAGARRIKIKRRVVHRDGQRQTVRKRVVVLDSRVTGEFSIQGACAWTSDQRRRPAPRRGDGRRA